MKYTKTRLRILIHKLDITTPVGCLKFDIRLPDGVKSIRSITVTTNA